MKEYLGSYILIGDYIALRDQESSEWRLSRVTGADLDLMTFDRIDTFQHLWEVREYVAKVRRAIIKGDRDLETVRRYLPANYKAWQDGPLRIVIEGVDNAGWTLDGYVIPRLESGLIYAKEEKTT